MSHCGLPMKFIGWLKHSLPLPTYFENHWQCVLCGKVVAVKSDEGEQL